MRKVCLAASSGGHLDEIMNLEMLAEQYELLLLTEKTGHEVSAGFAKVYYVPQVNRREWKCVLKLIVNALGSLWLLCKEKPFVVISTGALATVPICILAKLMGKRVLFIESFARVNSPSKTGKLLYRIADQTIVQWEGMKKFYPKAICGGSIY